MSEEGKKEEGSRKGKKEEGSRKRKEEDKENITNQDHQPEEEGRKKGKVVENRISGRSSSHQILRKVVMEDRDVDDEETDRAVITISQDGSLREDCDRAIQRLTEFKRRYDQAKDFTHPVYYNKKAPRHAEMKLHACKEGGDSFAFHSPSETLGVRIKDIWSSDFLVISDEPPRTVDQLKDFQKVDGVKIHYDEAAISTGRVTRPRVVLFTSGSEYFLSDGYSVRHCKNLQRVSQMTVGDEVRILSIIC